MFAAAPMLLYHVDAYAHKNTPYSTFSHHGIRQTFHSCCNLYWTCCLWFRPVVDPKRKLLLWLILISMNSNMHVLAFNWLVVASRKRQGNRFKSSESPRWNCCNCLFCTTSTHDFQVPLDEQKQQISTFRSWEQTCFVFYLNKSLRRLNIFNNGSLRDMLTCGFHF